MHGNRQGALATFLESRSKETIVTPKTCTPPVHTKNNRREKSACDAADNRQIGVMDNFGEMTEASQCGQASHTSGMPTEHA